MSKNKIFAIGLIASWVFPFLCFAFVLLELNPFKWEEVTRGLYLFIATGLMLLTMFLKSELNE